MNEPMEPIGLPEQCDPPSGQAASAPYNFVPLPDRVVPATTPPDHDTFSGLTGYFDVTLTTLSPLYIRGMLTEVEFAFHEERKDRDGKAINDDTPFRKLVKNKPEFFHVEARTKPVLPGSSLRGMLRTVVEIVNYSKVQPVSRAKIFFRAVAAEKEDPLERPYENVIGNNASNVKVGYLLRENGRWKVRPARRPHEVDSRMTKDPYLSIRVDPTDPAADIDIQVTGYMDLSHPRYRPQCHQVSFAVGQVHYTNTRGVVKAHNGAAIIRDRYAELEHDGVLICSGNMLETDDSGQPSRRKRIYLVMDADPNPEPLPIADQAIQDYRDGLTPFQEQSPPFDGKNGMLQVGRPIFYVPAKVGEEIRHIGHTPNFRIGAYRQRSQAVSTPMDFVPPSLGESDDEPEIDFAEAVFGFVRTATQRQALGVSQGDPQAAYAGRLFVSDARLVGDAENIFFQPHGDNIIVPPILASPKPTAYQHYLAQSDYDKEALRHYGSDTPRGTVIRGHKLYWHQGRLTPADLKPKPGSPGTDQEGHVKPNSTQHTQMQPLRAGLNFQFRIRFVNLSEVELGALAWALALPYGYAHKLGMGKPLGMGAVRLEPTLHLQDPAMRYGKLFAGQGWADGPPADALRLEEHREVFEKHMLAAIGSTEKKMANVERIASLLELLRWHDSLPNNVPHIAHKHYMTLAEFDARRVLGHPLAPAGAPGGWREGDPPRRRPIPAPLIPPTAMEPRVKASWELTAAQGKQIQGPTLLEPGNWLKSEVYDVSGGSLWLRFQTPIAFASEANPGQDNVIGLLSAEGIDLQLKEKAVVFASVLSVEKGQEEWVVHCKFERKQASTKKKK